MNILSFRSVLVMTIFMSFLLGGCAANNLTKSGTKILKEDDRVTIFAMSSSQFQPTARQKALVPPTPSVDFPVSVVTGFTQVVDINGFLTSSGDFTFVEKFPKEWLVVIKSSIAQYGNVTLHFKKDFPYDTLSVYTPNKSQYISKMRHLVKRFANAVDETSNGNKSIAEISGYKKPTIPGTTVGEKVHAYVVSYDDSGADYHWYNFGRDLGHKRVNF